jgi:hypothetical protein
MENTVLSMFIATILVYVVSNYTKPTTGIHQVDPFISYVKSQGTFIPYIAILVGIISFLTQEFVNQFEPDSLFP